MRQSVVDFLSCAGQDHPLVETQALYFHRLSGRDEPVFAAAWSLARQSAHNSAAVPLRCGRREAGMLFKLGRYVEREAYKNALLWSLPAFQLADALNPFEEIPHRAAPIQSVMWSDSIFHWPCVLKSYRVVACPSLFDRVFSWQTIRPGLAF